RLRVALEQRGIGRDRHFAVARPLIRADGEPEHGESITDLEPIRTDLARHCGLLEAVGRRAAPGRRASSWSALLPVGEAVVAIDGGLHDFQRVDVGYR